MERRVWVPLLVIALVVFGGVGWWIAQHPPKRAVAKAPAPVCHFDVEPELPPQDVSSGAAGFNLCVGEHGGVAKPKTYTAKTGQTVTFFLHGTDGREDTFAIDGYPDVKGEIDTEDTKVRFVAAAPGSYALHNESQGKVLGTFVVSPK